MKTIRHKKVVLIVTDGRDYSIKDVSDWILFYSNYSKIEILVLDVSNSSLEIKSCSINSDTDLLFEINGKQYEFKFSSIIGVFIRQSSFVINGHNGVVSNSGEKTNIKSRTHNYLMAYEETLRGFLLNMFSKKNIIGYDSGSVINKLEVLKTAAEIGFIIPETLLVNNKHDLLKLYKEQLNGLITKSLAINLFIFDLKDNLRFNQLTHLIAEEDFEKIPEKFPLSLVQGRVEKEFEIRTFYLDGICTSWALLSQSNEKTEVDYRNYDWENPMRVVSFSLPKDIEKKVTLLMEELQLRTGSIDFIYTRKGEYVFLEVNPAGQYGYNSDAGNNYLDKKIAEALIFRNETKKHRVSHS